MTTMKLFLTTLAAISIALTGAQVASADEDMYLTELRQKVANPLTDAQAFQLGQVACNALRKGINSGLSMGQSRHQTAARTGSCATHRHRACCNPKAMMTSQRPGVSALLRHGP